MNFFWHSAPQFSSLCGHFCANFDEEKLKNESPDMLTKLYQEMADEEMANSLARERVR